MSIQQTVWRQFRPIVEAGLTRLRVRNTMLHGASATLSVDNVGFSRRIVTNLPDVWPFEAGYLQLRIAVDAAVRAGVPYLVVPPRNGVSFGLIIRDTDASAFWRAMTAGRERDGVYAMWNGPWGEATRLLSDCTPEKLRESGTILIHRFLRTDRRGIAPQDEIGCIVEQWSGKSISGPEGSAEAWAAATNNYDHPRLTAPSRLVQWRREDEVPLAVPWGDVPTLRPFLRDGLESRPFPVDAVYLWVDGDDPKWRHRRDEVLARTGKRVAPDAALSTRFRHHDELRYALRSLEYFAPWIRRVFLLTDQQRPEWLVDDPETITVVDHREIWDDPSALPVFNSHAITSRMHHIPGLAENFLYLNDDVFFGAPVLAHHWFSPSGQPIVQNTSSTLPDEALLPALPTHVHARYNSLALVTSESGFHPTHLFQHGPIAQSRSWSFELEERFPEAYDRTMRSRFRQTTDIEPIWLHHYLGLVEGRTIRGSLKYTYIGMANADARERLAHLMADRSYQVFCLNDDDSAPPENLAAMRDFMHATCPVPSRFEKSGALPPSDPREQIKHP